jgi:tetratricopeptide (TPR) repeat protein
METNWFTEFIASSNSTTLAVISFLGAIISILSSFAKIVELIIKIKEKLLQLFHKEKKVTVNNKRRRMKMINYKPLVIGFILLSISSIIFSYQYSIRQNIPLNQKLTKEAWDYYNNRNFENAIEKANECIKLYRGQAELKQEELLKKGTSKPNSTPDSKEKKEIFSRGLLNDVATCYYIKGASYEELKKNEEAVKSYSKAEYFTYAMCWDPQGWFWNVSEAASGKLKEMSSN